jgi:hypothetical protein
MQVSSFVQKNQEGHAYLSTLLFMLYTHEAAASDEISE